MKAFLSMLLLCAAMANAGQHFDNSVCPFQDIAVPNGIWRLQVLTNVGTGRERWRTIGLLRHRDGAYIRVFCAETERQYRLIRLDLT